MAPPPGVRPHVTIHGLGLALTIGLLLWAVAVLVSWVAWSLAGPFGVVVLWILVAAFFGAVLP